MKLTVKHPRFFEELSTYFATIVRILLNVLLIITVLALLVGVVKSGIDLFKALHEDLETILQNMLLDVVFIVALVEITTTILGYLRDGRVEVRYIVDTIMIIMLNEIVSLWFNHPQLQQMIGISVVIAVLAGVRVTAIKFRDEAGSNTPR